MFYDNFCKLCKGKNLKPTNVALEIGVSRATATKWKNGSIPSGDSLIKLADYFDVSVDYLLSDDTKKETAEIIDSPQDTERRQLLRQAMEMASTLSDDKLRRLIEILKSK